MTPTRRVHEILVPQATRSMACVSTSSVRSSSSPRPRFIVSPSPSRAGGTIVCNIRACEHKTEWCAASLHLRSRRPGPRASLVPRASSTCYSSATGRRDDPIPSGAARAFDTRASRRFEPPNAPASRDDALLPPWSPPIRRAPKGRCSPRRPEPPIFPTRADPRAALARRLVFDPSSPHIRSAPGPYPSGFLDPDAPLDAPSRVARASCCA